MLNMNEPLSKTELSDEFLNRLVLLAKTVGNNVKDYETIKDFIDLAFTDAGKISPSDKDYEPFSKD